MVTLLLTVRPDFAPCCPDFSAVTARFAGEYYRKVLSNRHFAPTSHRKSPTWPLNGRKSLFALFFYFAVSSGSGPSRDRFSAPSFLGQTSLQFSPGV